MSSMIQFKQQENNLLQFLLRSCSVFSHEMVGQVQSQEGTQERHREMKLIILTRPRETVKYTTKGDHMAGRQGKGLNQASGKMRERQRERETETQGKVPLLGVRIEYTSKRHEGISLVYLIDIR